VSCDVNVTSAKTPAIWRADKLELADLVNAAHIVNEVASTKPSRFDQPECAQWIVGQPAFARIHLN